MNTYVPTSFQGPLLFPSPGAREEGKRRGPGNEVDVRPIATPSGPLCSFPILIKFMIS